jgi:hypothetical protein
LKLNVLSGKKRIVNGRLMREVKKQKPRCEKRDELTAENNNVPRHVLGKNGVCQMSERAREQGINLSALGFTSQGREEGRGEGGSSDDAAVLGLHAS